MASSMWGGANWLKKESKNKRMLKMWNRRYIKMVILLYYYDYYYYSLFKKHTFISKKMDKPKHYNRWVTVYPHKHTHTHLPTIVGLLLAVLGVKSRTIVNLKTHCERVALLVFPWEIPTLNPPPPPSGRAEDFGKR